MKPPVILDNRADEYEAFDSEGRRLTLGTAPGGRYGNKRVIITQVDEAPRHQTELRTRLASFRRRAGIPADPNATLDALVNAFATWCHQQRQ
jgi:hypothetical protein